MYFNDNIIEQTAYQGLLSFELDPTTTLETLLGYINGGVNADQRRYACLLLKYFRNDNNAITDDEIMRMPILGIFGLEEGYYPDNHGPWDPNVPKWNDHSDNMRNDSGGRKYKRMKKSRRVKKSRRFR